MDALAQIRKPIEEDLKRYRELFVSTLKHDNPLLRVALDHLTQRQGKMMRPIMVLLAARYVGEVNESVLHAAVALEMLHTASLVHDDVVDESDKRRGQKSINALMDNKVAVLVGDFLLSKALYHAAQTNSQQVVNWVALLGQTLADGELQQLANIDSSDLSEEAYYKVIRKKTASLFKVCAQAGAFLAAGDVKEVRQMADFGECLGVCFQMRDDIFDYDKQNDAGKPTGNDMKEGKLTLPVLYAVSKPEAEYQRSIALKVRQAEASEEEIADLVTFTREQGGIDYALESMQTYCDKALAMLNENRDSAIVESLQYYVKFVANRTV